MDEAMNSEMSDDLKNLFKEIVTCPKCIEAQKKIKGTVFIVEGQPVIIYMCKKHTSITVSAWKEWIKQGKP